MMIERQLEIDLAAALSALPAFAGVQIACSRSGTRKEAQGGTVAAVACGFRQNDAFSLSPITVNAAVTVITRSETDTEAARHDEIVEAAADLLSRWHKYGGPMADALSNEKFLAGELRMDGGSAREFDQMTSTWRDTLNFSIRGAEKFPAQDISD